MKQKWIFIFFILFISLVAATGQKDDPVLFTLGDQEVKVSEFLYIYNKNNGKEADYSRASLEEYLDLYIKFKMKVAKARDLKLDTIKDLSVELAGYRRQLANSYLTDKEVVERLSKELFEREQHDIEVAHILVQVDPQVTGKDTLGFYQKALSIYKELKDEADFTAMAKKYSEDSFTKDNGGLLGYLTAPLAPGFYNVETAAYTTPVGGFSKPVRSKIGYHIVKVLDKRVARGEMEVAHILCRKKKKGEADPQAEARCARIHGQLLEGENFEVLAKKESDDKNTSNQGGYIGFFGINQFESAFENAAFDLKEDGSFSKPVETSIGWHIIKRLSKKPTLSYERQRRRLQEDIKKDERYEQAQRSMIKRIKTNAGYTDNKAALDSFINMLDKRFYSINWKIPSGLEKDTVVWLGNDQYTIRDFAEFAKENTRTRLRFSRETPLAVSVNQLFTEFTDQICIQYEEANLERNYPDFRALMREYEEGILLFEATKINVWDKASKDTSGLEDFYAKHKDDYVWGPRAQILDITLGTGDREEAEKMKTYILKKGIDKAVKKYNKKETLIKFTKKLSEEKAKKDYQPLEFKAGVSTELKTGKEGEFVFRYIPKMHKPANKTMDEARGYIIADYQDELEKRWIASLQKEYPVELDQEVFESLIRE